MDCTKVANQAIERDSTKSRWTLHLETELSLVGVGLADAILCLLGGPAAVVGLLLPPETKQSHRYDHQLHV